jgi:glycosyltransferase involved in cell wall biosynthesis
MKITTFDMKIGYIFTTFPSRSETFAVREIEELTGLGFDITVLAAALPINADKTPKIAKILYRPALLSQDTFTSIGYILMTSPLAIIKLFGLILKLAWLSPREAILITGNLHTICCFAKYLHQHHIAHIHAYFLSWPACIGLSLAKITNLPFSIAAHARDIFVEHGAVELKLSHANFIVTCTQQGLKHLKSVLPKKYHPKLYLNRHGIKVNQERFGYHKKNLFDTDAELTVIAVGRLIEKKGFSDLIFAFADVVQDNPKFKLMIVGEGPLRKHLNELIRRLTLENYVHLLGWQTPDLTLRLIEQAAVLVAPSIIANDGDRDGIPQVILEAFACGTTVIAGNLEGISEAVEHYKTGLLVNSGNIRGLSSAIRELLNNQDLRDYLSRNAYQTLKQRFNPENNTRQLARLFVETNRCSKKQ